MRYFICLTAVLLSFLSLVAQTPQRHRVDDIYYPIDITETKNDRLLLSTSGGLYYSDDRGDSWSVLDTWINSHYFEQHFTKAHDNLETYIWDRTATYYTTDGGTNWRSLDFYWQGQQELDITAVDVVSYDTVWVGTTSGLFAAVGDNDFRNARLVQQLGAIDITSIASKGKVIVAGTKSSGVFVSIDAGMTWEERSAGLPPPFDVAGLVFSGDKLFVYSGMHGFYESTDNGAHWVSRNDPSAINQVNNMSINGDKIYLATNSYQNVYVTPFDGGPWTSLDNGLPDGIMQTIFADDDILIVGGWNSLSKSTNDGSTYTSAYHGIEDAVFANLDVDRNGTLWATSYLTGIFKKEIGDMDFTVLDRPIQAGHSRLIGDTLYVITPYKTRFYDVIKRQWVGELDYLNVQFQDRIVKAGDRYYMSSMRYGVFASNGTAVWDTLNTGLGSTWVYTLSYAHQKLWAGTQIGLYQRGLTDNEWTRLEFSTTVTGVMDFFVFGDVFIVMAMNGKNYVSFDRGNEWRELSDLQNYGIASFTEKNGKLYAMGQSDLVISGDHGKTWTATDLPYEQYTCIAVDDKRAYFGTNERGITSIPLATNEFKEEQEIVFAEIPSDIVEGNTYTLQAIASSGLPIVYSVISGPATINGNILTITGSGDVVIQANQPGDSKYNSKTVQITMRVQSITAIEENEKILFDAYPNPATNYLRLYSGGGKECNAQLLSLLGEQISTSLNFTGEQEVSLKGVKPGLYLIRFSNQFGTGVRKILIK